MTINQKIIFGFVGLSLLVSYTEKKEIFPIFNWELFARLPKYHAYNTLLMTSGQCGLDRRPITSFLPKRQAIYILRELWGNHSWENPDWQKNLNQEIAKRCDQAVQIESVRVIAHTLSFWEEGKWEKIKTEYGLYHSPASAP